jgi:hypothetical protein
VRAFVCQFNGTCVIAWQFLAICPRRADVMSCVAWKYEVREVSLQRQVSAPNLVEVAFTVRIYMDIPLNSYEEILINLKGLIHVFPNGL